MVYRYYFFAALHSESPPFRRFISGDFISSVRPKLLRIAVAFSQEHNESPLGSRSRLLATEAYVPDLVIACPRLGPLRHCVDAPAINGQDGI